MCGEGAAIEPAKRWRFPWRKDSSDGKIRSCPGRLVQRSAGELLSPDQFDFAEANSIAWLYSGGFQSASHANAPEHVFEPRHAFSAFLVGHGDQAFDTFATHGIDALLAADRESVFRFWAEDRPGGYRRALGSLTGFGLHFAQAIGGEVHQFVDALARGG